MAARTPIKLKIPRQDLQVFRLFELKPDPARAWAQALPVTDIRTVVEELDRCLHDLNRVRLSPEARYPILEAIRPTLDITISNLSRRFLNQPLVLPQEASQLAQTGTDLLNMAATSYTITALEAIQHRDDLYQINPAQLACEAIQRAMMYASRKLLQTLQLYRPLELHGWNTLHQLFELAERQQLTDLPVTEPLAAAPTIRRAYLQGVLLGCCKPNQLRQTELAAFYLALCDWSEFIELNPASTEVGLFAVDLHGDQPPVYRSQIDALGDSHRVVDTSKLLDQLQSLRSHEEDGLQLDDDTSLPASTLDHLARSLGEVSVRHFTRARSSGKLLVCLGISNTHYHVAGNRLFEDVLYDKADVTHGEPAAATNPFLSNEPDGQLPTSETVYVAPVSTNERYPIYLADLCDASPAGYCLEWSETLPGDIRVGDILGLRESQASQWAVAVIRWFNQTDIHRSLIGVELLSPKAIPLGARIHLSNGDKAPPMRVLLLPELKVVGQSHSLITPRASFRESQKVTLFDSQRKHTVQLGRQRAATGSFIQFEFSFIEELGDVLAKQRPELVGDAYDSLWSDI